MFDYLEKKLEIILDSIVDPIVAKVVALSWRMRVLILLIATSACATFAYPELILNGATNLVRFVKIEINSDDKLILSQDATTRLHASSQILWTTLNSILDNPHDFQLTPWVAAEVATARSEPDQSFKSALEIYFRNTKVPECGCWRELPNTDKSPRLVHVSGWVLSAMAMTEIAAKDDEISFLLDRQAEAGWWPMYIISSATDASASTYATAWALIGLQAQLSAQSATATASRLAQIQSAISKGSAWLIRTRAESARWEDYPLSEVGRISESISGLVLHALTVTNASSSPDLSRQWLLSMPASVPPPDAVEQSGILAETMDGPQTDYFLQFKLPWLIVGTVDAYQYGSISEKVAATKWIENSILQEGVRKMERDPLPWKRAELLVALRYLESHLSPQHKP